MPNRFILKLWGLPIATTAREVLEFFGGLVVKDGINGIHMVISREGRHTGEAYIEFITEEDVIMALDQTWHRIRDRHPIHLMRVNPGEMEYMRRRSGPEHNNDNDGCVRLRGLPYKCSAEHIEMFFSDLAIAPQGIILISDDYGKSIGEAYVKFINKEVADNALQRNQQRMGRYVIKIFRSSIYEFLSALENPYCRTGETSSKRPKTYRIRMSGLSVFATEQNVVDFFRPVQPVKIHLVQLFGRQTGDANVFFATYMDAMTAMRKNNMVMGQREVQLILLGAK